jgi:hypothetical protein
LQLCIWLADDDDDDDNDDADADADADADVDADADADADADDAILCFEAFGSLHSSTSWHRMPSP